MPSARGDWPPHLDTSEPVAVVEVGPLGVQHDAAAAMEEVGAAPRHIRVLGILAQTHKGSSLLHQEVAQPHEVKVGAHKNQLACSRTQNVLGLQHLSTVQCHSWDQATCNILIGTRLCGSHVQKHGSKRPAPHKVMLVDCSDSLTGRGRVEPACLR